ncbi:hypothetical protein NR798_17710 [Archangium gephyra]|uniref:hypothetical protein n=1 Tax=Archangium gephyra TaxID=48 RepID=UPI0035D3D997
MKGQKGWLIAVSVAVSGLMACAHAPEGYRAPGAKPEGLLVVKKDDAVKSGLPEWSLAMPLGEKQDESVLKFLEQAEAVGARYVSDLNVVYAAQKDGQWLECRTHIEPVATLDYGWRVGVLPLGPLMRQVPVSWTSASYTTQCRGDSASPGYCKQVPQQTAPRYAYQLNIDVRRYDQLTYARRWRLQKSAPECSPLGEGEQTLAGRFLRVEGQAYGCGEASGLGCEDRVL